MIISIDGPAGSGKSTVACLVGERLGFLHFNSGSLYRAITAHLIAENFDFSSIKIDSMFEDFKLETKFVNGEQRVFVDGIDYTSRLRDNDVSINTAKVSTNRFIRNKIDACQREFGKTNNLVVDGRDIGSFVFPNAELKIYLDCAVSERAKRRFLEEKAKNSKVTIEEIEQQLIERDNIDKTKKIAPLVVPENAIIIDSTNLTIDEVVEKIVNLAKKHSKDYNF